LFDDPEDLKKTEKLDAVTMALQQKFGMGIVKSGNELISEKRLDAKRS